MRQGKKIRCIFILPLLLLLVWFGASLSNVLPGRGGERTIGVTPPGAPPEGAGTAAEMTGYGGFDEPEWIDYPVCRMLYRGLSENEQEAYRALYDAVLAHKETVYIPVLTAQELSNVHAALKYDNPQLPCISDEFSYGTFGALCYIKMQYDYTKAECDALSGALISTAKAICGDCADRDEYGREVYLHDALVRLSDYSDGGVNSNNAAGPLVDRKGVCAGYALGMKLMCDISGIDSCVVRGTAESESGSEAHAWIVVKIDGNWYHVDPTWDDPVNTYDRDQLTHAYFNLSSAWISTDHHGFTLPEGVTCEAETDNYYLREGLYCDANSWRSVIKEKLAESLPSLPFDMEMRFPDAALFDSVYGDLMDGALNKMMNELIRENGYGIERWRVSIQTFGSMNTLRLIVSEDTD